MRLWGWLTTNANKQRETFVLVHTSQNEPEVDMHNVSLLVKQNIRIVPILHLIKDQIEIQAGIRRDTNISV